MKINAERLWDLHLEAAAFTDPSQPYTRLSFTPYYRDMREWLREAFQGAGMSVSLDAAANLIGVYEGSGPRQIAVGSHSDTVPWGGRFDGITGVLSFVEAIRCMKEAGFYPGKQIVGIDFLAEEPSEFQLSCIGSRLATGEFTPEMLELEHQETGVKLKDAIEGWGGDISRLYPGKPLFDAESFDGFLELHIEQGPILESRSLDVGLVEGICSVTRYDFTVLGRADHAGNTPMNMRSDALVAAARMIDAISRIGEANMSEGIHFTATVGKLDVYPNGSNVIAERVLFSLDIRSENNDLVEESLGKIHNAATEISNQTKTGITSRKISRSRTAASDPALLNILEENAEMLNLSYARILSGAGHDAAYMSRIMPMAMIFIPCKGGVSHTSSEFSSMEQIEKGADLLLRSLVRLSA